MAFGAWLVYAITLTEDELQKAASEQWASEEVLSGNEVSTGFLLGFYGFLVSLLQKTRAVARVKKRKIFPLKVWEDRSFASRKRLGLPALKDDVCTSKTGLGSSSAGKVGGFECYLAADEAELVASKTRRRRAESYFWVRSQWLITQEEETVEAQEAGSPSEAFVCRWSMKSLSSSWVPAVDVTRGKQFLSHKEVISGKGWNFQE